MDIWDRRRKNLGAWMGYKRIKGTELSRQAGLSTNTVTKFISGSSYKISQDSLDKICRAMGISNPAILDQENPFSPSKNRLYDLIENMTEEEAKEYLKHFETRVRAD